MSLREEILEHLPAYVYEVKVKRNNYKGTETINVVVNYRDKADKPWFLDINFSEKNKMDARHMAKVIYSYIKMD
jgi:hypothetical protein